MPAEQLEGQEVPDFAQWRTGVAGVLAKARRVDPSRLPAEPEQLLAVRTYDGLDIAPLYTARDERPEQPLPGVFPFVRGRAREVERGWHVVADISVPDPAAANQRILDELNTGSTAIRLGVGTRGVPVGQLPAALAGVLFELAPLALVAGADTSRAAQRLYSVLDGYSCPDRAAIAVSLGAAPLTDRFVGLDTDLEIAVEAAQSTAGRGETIRAITIDGSVFHNAGAGDAQELGAAVAAGLEYLRVLTTAGFDITVVLRQLEFRFSASVDQFQATAKFRAARQLWARVAQICGAPEAGDAPQHAVSSAAMLTRRDPWVNLLRGTLAAFGAGVGGADSVTVLPFDAALPPGTLGVSEAFSTRMARNTQLLLLEESHLGKVLDPGAGSWYVEDLTAKLADRAWEFLQELERAGGYRAALDSGLLAERIADTAAARAADIAHRRTAITGVNEFPDLSEKALEVGTATAEFDEIRYYGQAFEALRERSDVFLSAVGARPKVLLIPLGPIAEHNIRTSFTANVLAAGGIEAVNPGPLSVSEIAATVTESAVSIAVLCGSDTRYAAEADEAIAVLREVGVETVLLAGPQKAVTGPHRPDGFLTARMDAVAVLSDLLAKLGA